MTDVHVTCLACFINPLKIAMWIVNEKWNCWNSECIVFRCDLLYRQAYFLGEKDMSLNTRICFWDNNICNNGFIQAFLHGLDSNLFFFLKTKYLLCKGLGVGSPCWFLTSEECKQELISVSRPPRSSTCQVWRSSLPYYWLDPTALWMRDWMLWLSSSPLLSLTLSISEPPAVNKSPPLISLFIRL